METTIYELYGKVKKELQSPKLECDDDIYAACALRLGGVATKPEHHRTAGFYFLAAALVSPEVHRMDGYEDEARKSFKRSGVKLCHV